MKILYVKEKYRYFDSDLGTYWTQIYVYLCLYVYIRAQMYVYIHVHKLANTSYIIFS